MLSQSFLGWWFEPWEYATDTSGFPLACDSIARRDAYRIWCHSTGLEPDLPSRFDPGWCVAASVRGDAFSGTARLFCGLIALRSGNMMDFDCLSFEDRKWCASVSAIQPLRSVSGLFSATRGLDESAGMAELAIYLEQGFPGLWPRLRLILSGEAKLRIASLLQRWDGEERPEITPAASARAQRCWRMCAMRFGQRGAGKNHDPRLSG